MDQKFLFKREFEGRFRLWHWLMALCVFGLLLTGLLRETYLNSGKNGQIISAKLSELNISIDKKDAKNIAAEIRNPMWQWHYNFGFGLLGIAIFGIYVRKSCQGSCPIEKAKSALIELKERAGEEDKKQIREFFIIKLSHSMFFVLLLVMMLTGFAMFFKDSLGLPKDLLGLFKEAHELGLWFVLLFVVTHIVGVVKKELTTESGLISSIIGGK